MTRILVVPVLLVTLGFLCAPVPALADLGDELFKLTASNGAAGAAHYHVGEFELATRALEKAIELQGDNEFVLFFLAMAEWQLGMEGAARETYGNAVEWMESQRPDDEVLLRFRNEAAELLGIPKS